MVVSFTGRVLIDSLHPDLAGKAVPTEYQDLLQKTVENGRFLGMWSENEKLYQLVGLPLLGFDAVLLAGKRGVVDMALLKFALELVLIVNVRMQQGEYLLAGARVAVCFAFLVLLLRGAGRVRIAVAILLFAAYLGVEALALTEALAWLAE